MRQYKDFKMDAKQPKVIYTICTIENLGSNIRLPYDVKDSDGKIITKGEMSGFLRNRQNNRTPGFFLTLEDAKECVEENWGDIHETGYDHVVIEKMPEGLYGGITIGNNKEWWYKWEGDRDEGKYVEIEKPECTKGTCNWGIG